MIISIEFGSVSFDAKVIVKARKTLTIQVHPDGEIYVSAPDFLTRGEIASAIKRKAPWIIKQQNQFALSKPQTPPRKYVSGETHLYLGRQYRLKISHSETDYVKVYKGWMHVGTPNPNSIKIEKLVKQWYRIKANQIFDNIVDDILPKFSKYKIEKPQILIRTMRKRWGSCGYNGKITLNTELVKAPKGSIEYVITHEICHLIFLNHNKEFYHLQSKMMPDWMVWKKRLEKCLL